MAAKSMTAELSSYTTTSTRRLSPPKKCHKKEKICLAEDRNAAAKVANKLEKKDNDLNSSVKECHAVYTAKSRCYRCTSE